jgi:hypothetical protein
MFTTIDGVVRFLDTWVDSIPVPGVAVRAIEETTTRTEGVNSTTRDIVVASVRTDSNGAFSISFTASCVGPGRLHEQRFRYWLVVDNYQVFGFEPANPGHLRTLRGVCDIPAIQHDLWVTPK